MPDDVAELARRFHPELKATIKAALKDILADPTCGKALKDDLHGLRSYRVKLHATWIIILEAVPARIFTKGAA